MMSKYFSETLSILAIVLAAGALYISYLQYQNNFIEPELHWIISDYKISKDSDKSYQISSNIRFSVTNKSGKDLFLSTCNFENDRAFRGRGAWEVRWTKCPNFEKTLISDGEIVIKAGQTRFFEDVYKLKIFNEFGAKDRPFGSPELTEAAKRMGLISDRGNKSLFPTDRESCSFTFTLRPESASYGGNCKIDKDATLYRLFLQTGDGQTMKRNIRMTFKPDWPWDTLLR